LVDNPEKVGHIDDVEVMAKYLVSVHGIDLFRNKRVRQALIESLPTKKLQHFASELGKKVTGNPQELAFSIADSPWREGSKFVWLFAKEFAVPPSFLPAKVSFSDPIEFVVPDEKLPKLFDYQIEVKDKLVHLLELGKGSTLVQMPTGAGKTRAVIEALVDHLLASNFFDSQKIIIWLANTEELCTQAIDTFIDIWSMRGIYPAKVGRLWGAYNPRTYDLQGTFLVGSLQKLHSLYRRNSELFNVIKNSLLSVVVDEAHNVLAPTYKKVLKDLGAGTNNVLIGVSATPGRGAEKYHENIELSRFFGRKLIQPSFGGDNPIAALKRRGILSEVVRYERSSGVRVSLTSQEEDYSGDFLDLPTSLLARLANDTGRNKEIVHIVSQQLSDGNPCLVFSCSVDHAKQLSVVLNFLGFNAAYISCDMRVGYRRSVVESFRSGSIDVLFNYGVLSTGFDAPRVKAVIITRPTSSLVLYSQMIGRGLRGPLVGGTSECTLIDIKDNFQNFGAVENVYDYFKDYWR